MNTDLLAKNQTRLQAAFARAEQENRAAFMPYFTAGFPDATAFLDIAELLLKHADLLEIGLPYSDPLGDGVTIQHAAERALAAGTSTLQTFALLEQLRKRCPEQTEQVPIILMTYINPVYALGPRQFMQRAAAAGITGFIFPDLPPDQDDEIAVLAAEYGLTVTFLIAPTSTPQRIALVAQACTGFVYGVSVTGVTGVRESDEAYHAVPEMLKTLRQCTSLPVAVGFGVKDRMSAQYIAQLANGVVVGSALVKVVHKVVQNGMEDGLELQPLEVAIEDIIAGCYR